MYKILIAIFLLTILLPNIQSQSDEVYLFFGTKNNFVFLQGIEKKITEAKKIKDIKSLCAYASLLFYAENLSEKKHSTINGLTILYEAANYAWIKKDIPSFYAVQAVWGSKFLGLNDKEGAEQLGYYIEELKKQNTNGSTNIYKDNNTTTTYEPKNPIPPIQKPTKTVDAQKFLMAEESAKLEGIERLCERIFGIMLNSMTTTKDFVTTKDVVVAELQKTLLMGVKVGEATIVGDEVRVPITVTKRDIIASIKFVMIRNKKTFTTSDENSLNRSLLDEYKETGVSFID
jgi:hypothetical protein